MLLRGFCPQGSHPWLTGPHSKAPPSTPSLELRIHLWRCLPQLSTWISCRHYSSTSLNLKPSSSCIFSLGVDISVSPSPELETLESCPLHLLGPLPFKAPNPPFQTGCIGPFLACTWKGMSHEWPCHIFICASIFPRLWTTGGRGHAWFHRSLAAPYVWSP